MDGDSATGSTILVTGASGCVGNAIQWAVSQRHPIFGSRDAEQWIFLSSTDGDLRHYEQARSLFQRHKPHQVIHLAARVGGVYENSLKSADFLRDNLAIDQNIMRLCKEFRVRKVVSCLSTCIFPDKTSYPIDESMLHNGPPHYSNFGYAYAKRMLDISNQAYFAQNHCNFTAIIPTNVYGPHDNFGEGSHIIPAIIKRVAQAKMEGLPKIQVAGTGKALRQFIHSRDLARLMLWALRKYDTPKPLIISVDQDQEVSIKDVVHIVCRLNEYGGSVEWDPSKIDRQLKKTADNTRMKTLVGEFAFTPLQQGLRETLAWYNANQGCIRDRYPLADRSTGTYKTVSRLA